MKTPELTDIECKAAWLCAEAGEQLLSQGENGGILGRDPFLAAAATRAVEKLWRASKGMPPKSSLFDEPEAA